MTVSVIVVICLFAVFVAIIVVLEVRSTQRMNTFIKQKPVYIRPDYAEGTVGMFLEWCRADPDRLKAELEYMRESIDGVTMKTHHH